LNEKEGEVKTPRGGAVVRAKRFREVDKSTYLQVRIGARGSPGEGGAVSIHKAERGLRSPPGVYAERDWGEVERPKINRGRRRVTSEGKKRSLKLNKQNRTRPSCKERRSRAKGTGTAQEAKKLK